MRFLFNTFNHGRQGQIIIEDITMIMGWQMMALDHEVGWSNARFEKGDGVYNVIIESFADDPATIARIAAAHANGSSFLYVATEEPTSNGFNHGLDPGMIDRQNAFPAAARYADGILHLIPGAPVTRWYSQFAPAAPAELGYSPGLFTGDDGVEPAYDFGFYGKMTWRREQMLGRLQDLGATIIKITTLDVPRLERDAIMRGARVILQIRANEEWGMVSSTRCATALCFGRPVVAEPHPFAKPWDEVLDFSASVEEFVTDAFSMARGDWRGAHARQFKRFKDRLTPERCIGVALREIGIL